MKVKRLSILVGTKGLILVFASLFLMASFVNLSPLRPTLAQAQPKPIKLKVCPLITLPPPAGGMTLAINESCKLIERRTNGRVAFELYWAESLAPGKELVTALNKGITDVAVYSPAYEPGKVPLETIGNMPGISDDYWARATAYWELISKHPALRAELAQWKIRPIGVFMISKQGLITSKVPVRSLADLKGLKIAAAGPGADAVKAYGGVPVAMTPSEQYEGLQRGTINAITTPLITSIEFKFHEQSKYYTYFDFGSRLYPMGINQDVWDKIPAQDQKIIGDSLPDIIKLAYDAFFKIGDPEAVEIMKKRGIELIDPNAADKAELLKLQDGLADKWAADMEAKGLPGKAVLSEFRNLVLKYEKISPYKK